MKSKVWNPRQCHKAPSRSTAIRYSEVSELYATESFIDILLLDGVDD